MERRTTAPGTDRLEVEAAPLVVLPIPPGGEIGLETHHLNQFFSLEQGKAKAIRDGVEHAIEDAWAVVPAGTAHSGVGDHCRSC